MLYHTDYDHDERQDIRDVQDYAWWLKHMAAEEPDDDEPEGHRDDFDPNKDAWRSGQ